MCIADGFRFYGWLYRTLGLVFMGAAFLCWVCQIADSFWITFLVSGGIYLWITAGLAFSGATDYFNSGGDHVWPLVAFLFFIAVFLIATLMAISIQVRFAQWLPDVANSIVTLSAMMFGVGSYLIELAALVANEPVRKVRRDRWT